MTQKKEALNEAIKEYLKEHLVISVTSKECYVGGIGESLYKSSYTVKLTLDGDVISEAYLD